MKKLTIIIFTLTTLLLSSCMSTKTSLRDYQSYANNSYTYAKGKQIYLFWGLIPMGHTNVSTPSDGVCQINTYRSFGDILISDLTGGLVTIQTIKVKAPKMDNISYDNCTDSSLREKNGDTKEIEMKVNEIEKEKTQKI